MKHHNHDWIVYGMPCPACKQIRLGWLLLIGGLTALALLWWLK